MCGLSHDLDKEISEGVWQLCVCGSYGNDWNLCACVHCWNVCTALAYSCGFTLSGRWSVHSRHVQCRPDRSEVSGIDIGMANESF